MNELQASTFEPIRSPEKPKSSCPLVIVFDVDRSLIPNGLLDDSSKEPYLLRDKKIRSIVYMTNLFLRDIAIKTKRQVIPAIVTTRPAEMFWGGGNPPLQPLRELCGYTPTASEKVVTEQIRYVGCENGEVELVRDATEKRNFRHDHQRQGKWESEDKLDFGWTEQSTPGEYYLVLEEVRDALSELFIDVSVDEESTKYEFENETQSFVSLQKINGEEFTPGEKKYIKKQLIRKLKANGHGDIVRKIFVDLSGNDVDVFPVDLYRQKKAKAIRKMRSKLKGLGYDIPKDFELIVIDDKFNAVEKARQYLEKIRGKFGLPSNADLELKEAAQQLDGSSISEYSEYWGTMASLYEAVFQSKPSVKHLEVKKILHKENLKTKLIAVGTEAINLARRAKDESWQMIGEENLVKLSSIKDLKYLKFNPRSKYNRLVPEDFSNQSMIVETSSQEDIKILEAFLINYLNACRKNGIPPSLNIRVLNPSNNTEFIRPRVVTSPESDRVQALLSQNRGNFRYASFYYYKSDTEQDVSAQHGVDEAVDSIKGIWQDIFIKLKKHDRTTN